MPTAQAADPLQLSLLILGIVAVPLVVLSVIGSVEVLLRKPPNTRLIDSNDPKQYIRVNPEVARGMPLPLGFSTTMFAMLADISVAMNLSKLPLASAEQFKDLSVAPAILIIVVGIVFVGLQLRVAIRLRESESLWRSEWFYARDSQEVRLATAPLSAAVWKWAGFGIGIASLSFVIFVVTMRPEVADKYLFSLFPA